jgi:hypothetical protein
MELVKTKADQPARREGACIPNPEDAFLLTFEEAGAYLRLSAASVRKLVDGRADTKDDELGKSLRGWVVRLSPHRRYIRRDKFLKWLCEVTGRDTGLAS